MLNKTVTKAINNNYAALTCANKRLPVHTQVHRAGSVACVYILQETRRRRCRRRSRDILYTSVLASAGVEGERANPAKNDNTTYANK